MAPIKRLQNHHHLLVPQRTEEAAGADFYTRKLPYLPPRESGTTIFIPELPFKPQGFHGKKYYAKGPAKRLHQNPRWLGGPPPGFKRGVITNENSIRNQQTSALQHLSASSSVSQNRQVLHCSSNTGHHHRQSALTPERSAGERRRLAVKGLEISKSTTAHFSAPVRPNPNTKHEVNNATLEYYLKEVGTNFADYIKGRCNHHKIGAVIATENLRKFLYSLRHRRPSTTALDPLWELIEFIEGPHHTQKLIQRKQAEILARVNEQQSEHELLQSAQGHYRMFGPNDTADMGFEFQNTQDHSALEEQATLDLSSSAICHSRGKGGLQAIHIEAFDSEARSFRTLQQHRENAQYAVLRT